MTMPFYVIETLTILPLPIMPWPTAAYSQRRSAFERPLASTRATPPSTTMTLLDPFAVSRLLLTPSSNLDVVTLTLTLV